jgi:hypothetical protein
MFILHKLLVEKGMMTALSEEVQYMDCSQHLRPLFLMVSNGLEDRRYLDNVSVIFVTEYRLIFNLLVNVSNFGVRITDSNESYKICVEV